MQINPQRTTSKSIIAAFAILLFNFFHDEIRAKEAEERGTITGVIRDSSGASIGKADIELINAQQISIQRDETDVEGRFRFEGIQIGTYLVQVQHPGFNALRKNVLVTAT